MKKRILALCGIGIVSIALASCGGNKEITYEEEKITVPTEKGNKVDNLNLIITNAWSAYSIELNSTMSFSEVFEQLYGRSYQLNHTSDNRKFKNINKITKKYEASNTFTFDSNLGFIFTDNESVDNVSYSYFDICYEKNIDNKNMKINDYYSSLNYEKIKANDGNKNISSISMDIDKTAGCFESTVQNDVTTEKVKKASKTLEKISIQNESAFSNTNNNSSTNKKYFIEASEKSTDSNYGYEYIGRSNKTGEVYYSISEEFIGNSGTNEDVYISYMFDANLSSLYEASYELTDKYIILKTKCDYTKEIDDIASRKVYNVSKDQLWGEKKKEILKLIENDYKGSSSEYEIWISHTGDNLYFDYYKASINTIYNIDRVYEESDFTSDPLYQSYLGGYIRTDPYGYKDYVGKKIVKKGNSSTYREMSTLEDNYDKKMNDLYAECEKDNAYKDLVFKPYYNPILF